jgi:hypothetical protein
MLPHLPAADESARAVRRPNMPAANLTEYRITDYLRLPIRLSKNTQKLLWPNEKS